MSTPKDRMIETLVDRSADGPDPELVELPSPRRPFRRLTLVCLVASAAAACALIGGLFSDASYACHRAAVRDVGFLANLEPAANQQNTWVRGGGELAPIGGIRFERPLEPDSFRLAPLQDNPRLWVQIRVPAGYEDEHFVAPTVFSGRLVRLTSTGIRYSTLALAPEAAGWKPGHLPENAWVLIDGETPASARWVLGLVGLFGAFAVFSLWGLVNLLRPVRRDLEARTA
jgi:hypothetical protein